MKPAAGSVTLPGWEGGEKTWPASKPCPGLTTTTSPTYCTTAWPSDASNCVTMGMSRSWTPPAAVPAASILGDASICCAAYWNAFTAEAAMGRRVGGAASRTQIVAFASMCCVFGTFSRAETRELREQQKLPQLSSDHHTRPRKLLLQLVERQSSAAVRAFLCLCRIRHMSLLVYTLSSSA